MKAVSRIALQKSDWNEKKREFNKKQLFPASVDFHLEDIKKGIIKNSLTILNDPYQLQKWRRAEDSNPWRLAPQLISSQPPSKNRLQPLQILKTLS